MADGQAPDNAVPDSRMVRALEMLDQERNRTRWRSAAVDEVETGGHRHTKALQRGHQCRLVGGTSECEHVGRRVLGTTLRDVLGITLKLTDKLSRGHRFPLRH